MKPDHLSWHEYLRGYARLCWERPGDEQRFHELLGLLQPLYALRCGDLLRTSGPKRVIAEATKPVAVRMGHAPYCFRVQCLVTGRKSKFIPYERLIEFGVLTQDTKTGGAFLAPQPEIVDRLTPIVASLQTELSGVRPIWDDPSGGIPWFQRYDEYLQSEQWLQLREQVLRRDNYRCVHSGKASRPGDPLQVHHVTYERVGCELLGDLVTVCRSQHQRIHAAAASEAK